MIETFLQMLRELLFELAVSFTAFALLREIERLRARVIRLSAEMFFANEHRPYVN